MIEKIVKFTVDTGFAGCEYETYEKFEFEDDATKEEMEEAFADFAADFKAGCDISEKWECVDKDNWCDECGCELDDCECDDDCCDECGYPLDECKCDEE
jgi:hypothetical protein